MYQKIAKIKMLQRIPKNSKNNNVAKRKKKNVANNTPFPVNQSTFVLFRSS